METKVGNMKGRSLSCIKETEPLLVSGSVSFIPLFKKMQQIHIVSSSRGTTFFILFPIPDKEKKLNEMIAS